MFKNESEVVAKKAQKRYVQLAKQKVSGTKSNALRMPGSEGSDSFAISNEWTFLEPPQNTQITPWTRYPTPESMSRELVPSIENQAQGFFIANYVAQPGLVPRGQFEWVTELLSQPHVDEGFRASVNAVSLAGLANATKNPAIMQKAQVAYGTALRITNGALMIKEKAIQDSILISVIMLGLYENMVFRDKRSIEAWAKHTNGASALINMRGPQQFKSSIGRRIFHQFYGIALLVALETGTTVHAGLHNLYEDLRPKSDYEVHGRQWTTRIVDVMHDAINLNQDKTSDPATMLSTAFRIDRELDEVKALMPSIWHYETVRIEEHSEYHYENFYSVYVDPWIAQMWNHLRSCRMYLYKAARENIKKGCEEYDPPLFSEAEVQPQKEGAEQVMRATVAGIIASVPQITGMIPFPTRLEPRDFTSRNANPEVKNTRYKLHPPGTYLNPAKSPGMVHLIWPLYAAGQSDFATYEMRKWCIETLQFIALRIGTRQAVVLADELIETQRAGKRSGPITSTLDSLDFFFDSQILH